MRRLLVVLALLLVPSQALAGGYGPVNINTTCKIIGQASGDKTVKRQWCHSTFGKQEDFSFTKWVSKTRFPPPPPSYNGPAVSYGFDKTNCTRHEHQTDHDYSGRQGCLVFDHHRIIGRSSEIRRSSSGNSDGLYWYKESLVQRDQIYGRGGFLSVVRSAQDCIWQADQGPAGRTKTRGGTGGGAYNCVITTTVGNDQPYTSQSDSFHPLVTAEWS